MLGDHIYHQCDTVLSADIGGKRTDRRDAEKELVCVTTNLNRDCCTAQDNRENSYSGAVGEWYFPDGTIAPRSGFNSPFIRVGREYEIRLVRANTTLSVPLGVYRCEVPDGSDGTNYSASIIISDGSITGQ